jgi:hypothetical protein
MAMPTSAQEVFDDPFKGSLSSRTRRGQRDLRVKITGEAAATGPSI